MPRHRRLVVAALAALVLAGASASAQIWVGGGRGYPARWPQLSDFDGSFVYCRGYYRSVRREESGSGWNTDYPNAEHNFSVRLTELTRVRVKLDSHREPTFVVMPLTDPLLYRCPILFMEDIGTAEFSPEEVLRLREYFRKGGFLWVDDSWGSYAWSMWVREIGRILPRGEYPIFDIPPEHPIMRTLYDVKEIPQVPSINRWYQMDGGTSERGSDSPYVNFRGIQDERGRLMVVMTHNTDISDTWEREGESKEYFDRFSPDGYAVGVNIILYALTH